MFKIKMKINKKNQINIVYFYMQMMKIIKRYILSIEIMEIDMNLDLKIENVQAQHNMKVVKSKLQKIEQLLNLMAIIILKKKSFIERIKVN